jgi:hypothetical protein
MQYSIGDRVHWRLSRRGGNPPMIYRLRFFMATLVVILVCTSCSGSEDINTGKAAIRHFHEQLNAGLPDEIYREAAREYQAAATSELNRKFIEAVRKKMGKAAHCEVTSWRLNYLTSGRFLALECKTTFDHGEAAESFRWRIEGKKALLLGWNINSPALVIN